MADSKGQQGKRVITQSRYSNAWISSTNDIFFTVNDVAQAYWPTSGFYYILLSGWANCEGYETPSWLAGTDRAGISSVLPRQLEMRLSKSFPVKEKAADAPEYRKVLHILAMLSSLPFPHGYNDQVSKRRPGLLLRSIDSAFQSLENQETEKTGLPVLTTASANGAAGTPSFLVAYKIYARLREWLMW